MTQRSDIFSIVALWTAHQCGRASTFILACFVVLVWAATGPLFHYSDTWQLVINTGTTIVTFLMCFLIQHSQNRDTAAIQLKLDELIRVNADARNKLLTLEDLTEEELDRMKKTFAQLAGDGSAQARIEDIQEAQESLAQAEEDIEKAQSKMIDAVAPKPNDGKHKG